MADHDDWDDWDDEDDTDVEPFASVDPATADASDTPRQNPPSDLQGLTYSPPPAYDDDETDDDDYLLSPPDAEAFGAAPPVARSRRSPSRARAVPSSGHGTEIDPVAQTEDFADDGDEAGPEVSRKQGCLMSLIVTVLVAVIVGAMVWALVSWGPLAGVFGDDDTDDALPPVTSSPETTSAPAPAPAASSLTAAEAADEECADSSGDTVAGNGRGSRDSGPDLIMAFDYAYYVDRDGAAARSLMSDEITGTTADSLQDAIDDLDDSAAHCLNITPKDDEEGVYEVDLIVFTGSGDDLNRSVTEQTIYVDEVDDELTIVGIINE